jgi:hypothetical protein
VPHAKPGKAAGCRYVQMTRTLDADGKGLHNAPVRRSSISGLLRFAHCVTRLSALGGSVNCKLIEATILQLSRRCPIALASPVPTHERLGPNDCENLQDWWKPAIQLDKEPSIMVREPDATMQPTSQDNQLMSKHGVLSFKPQLRLEWRGQNGQNETEQPDHSDSLGDSITSSTRIEFSVHTGGGLQREDVIGARGARC